MLQQNPLQITNLNKIKIKPYDEPSLFVLKHIIHNDETDINGGVTNMEMQQASSKNSIFTRAHS